MATSLGQFSVTFTAPKIDIAVYELITGKRYFSIPAIVASIGNAAGDELGGPAAVLAACTGFIHQDDDAHETCSLTACLNPLHPGPCKGWKGNLFKVAPNAYHALESARVEKANAARLAKIKALKDAGKPIPKKLLQPIVAKPHPHAGKTANSATGEAHAAGKAVSDAGGVHVNEPGKVTLGQAVKQIQATDATNEKGAKGKKPTVASKGIATVIAQEKVTPQYKLDKAAKITAEQWNALSSDEKSIIRGELAKIQKEGFGPQQKKATELLDALPAEGLKGGGTDTVTTPKGQVIQKVTLKDTAADVDIPNTASPLGTQKLLKKVGSLDVTFAKGTDYEKTFKDVGLTGDHEHKLITEGKGNWYITDKDGNKLQFLSKSGGVHLAKPGSKIEVKEMKQVGGTPTPPAEPSKPKLTPEQQAKIDAVVQAHEGTKPVVQEMKEPAAPKAGPSSAAQANAIAEISNALPTVKSMPEGASEKLVQAFDKLKEKGDLGDTLPFKKAVTALATAALKTASDDKVPGVGHGDNDIHNGTLHKEIAEHILAGKTGLPPMVAKIVKHHEAKADHEAKVAESEAKIKAAEQKLGDLKAKGEENQAALDVLKKQTALETPDGIPYTTKTPTNVVKDIQKNGYADLILGGKKIRVGFENSNHPGKLTMTNGTGIDSYYTVKEPDGTVHKLPKGVHVKVATGETVTPKIENAAESAEKTPALPKHVQHAAAIANHEAPGAGLSKNHLAAYEKLSTDEFNSLPADTQAKIIQELEKGQTKFLDPKKIKAAQELIEKFQAGKASAPAAPKSSEVDFYSHMKDHTVTDAQAKKAAAGQPVAAHAAVAKEYAGLDTADQPDVMAHEIAAKAYAKDLVASFVKDEPTAALNDPAVQDAELDVVAAAKALKQAQLVGQAKKNAYNKIDMALKGDTGKLSPIQKASLAQYQQYLLNHPSKTEPEDIAKLQYAVLNATDDLRNKIKAAKTPAPGDMTPAQLDSKISELLGPDAVQPHVNLSMAELKEANAVGANMAKLGTEKYSPATLENPEVAAKMKQVAIIAGQLAATAENKKKLQEHLSQHHYKALNDHDAGVGVFNAPQIAAIKAHAEKIKKEHAYLDTVTKEQQDKLIAARKEFDAAAEKVQNAPHEPVKLSDYDVDTISEVFGNNWAKQASKAVTYGLKTYSQKADMKAHPEYAPFTQDLGNLQTAVKKLAVAHGHAHTAELNVPTHPDTGLKVAGPEMNAWTAAMLEASQAEQDYNKLYKIAQARLDKIRTDVGLKKRALPKIDSPAVKAAAAESAYYKTVGYNGPNYGKHAAGKSYLIAKLGNKLGIKHESASEKKAAKAAAEAEKLKAAHPEFYAKKEADKAANATKAKVSTADAGKTPNAAAAEKFGFKHVTSTAPALGQWSYSAGDAYIANEDHLKQAQDILTGEDIQHGLAAQKQFKWSINNMEGKGAPHSQKASLYSYTGSGYDSVNTKLNSLPPGVEKTGSATITNIDNAMAASPPLEADVVLYRGFKNPHSVFSSGKWNDTNVAGMEWSQRSYSSTSGALSTAQSFAGYGGVVMRVIVPKGMKVHGINAKGGQHGGENEIILQRGLRYRVVADYGTHGNTRYIDVMVVPSPYAKSE
jgi:hypothetical protein